MRLVIEASSKTEADAIVRIRNQLLGEHCGSTAADVEELLDNTGSLVAVADILAATAIACGRSTMASRMPAIWRPISRPSPIPTADGIVVTGDGDARRRLAALSSLVTIVIAIGMLLVGWSRRWRYSPLSEYATGIVSRIV